MNWRRALLSLLIFAACPAPPGPPPDSGVLQIEDAGRPCFSAFPQQLDFGEIDAHTTAFTRVRLTNLTDRRLQPRPLPLALPFSFDGATFEALEPGASILLTVRFEPTDGLLHFATLELGAAGDCQLALPIRGLGRGAFSFSPTQLDFGMLDPGASRSLDLTLTNTQRTPVVFERLELMTPSSTAAPFAFDASVPLIIPAQSALTLIVTASPPGFELYDAVLSLRGPTGNHDVPMVVVGGVPVGRLEPSVIDVAKMDFTPGSNPPSFVDRVLRVRNIADGGSPFSALDIVPPLFAGLEADGGLTNDVMISFFGSIPAGGAQEMLVRVTPPGPGVRAYQLVVFTNSTATPELRVDVTVNALSLPPCTLQHPDSVSFTALTDAGSIGSVRFTNDSGVSCVLDNLRAGTPDFRITAGGVDQIELAPGAVHDVSLAGPDAGSRRSSLLLFHVLGPDSFEESLELVAPP